MDKRTFALLEADLKAQQTTLEQIYELLDSRSQGLSSEQPEKLESVGYPIHNVYGAAEDLFKVIAAYFENNVVETAQWHSRLLQRMSQPVVGVRPAVISQESYRLLNGLRAFRHFFRHAYGVSIDYGPANEQSRSCLGASKNAVQGRGRFS